MVSPIEVDDEASGMLITAVDVVDEPTDYGQFTPMLEQAEETTGSRACLTLADAGYYSGSNLSECAGRGRRWRCQRHHRDSLEVIRTTRIRTTRIGSPTMRAATVSGVPRERRSPSTVSASPPNGVHYRFYRAPGAVCRACPAFGVCTKSKDGRNATVGPYDAALRRHRAWMATTAAKEAYQLRKQPVEPVFGIIKEQQAGRRFLLRGLANVAAEWTVLATAFNLRTLWRVWRSHVCGHVFGGRHVPQHGPQSRIALPESCR